MTRIFPSAGGALCISGSTVFGGVMTPFFLLNSSLSVPSGASGTGVVGDGLGLIFSGGVRVGSPGVVCGAGACPAAVSTRTETANPQTKRPMAVRKILDRGNVKRGMSLI